MVDLGSSGRRSRADRPRWRWPRRRRLLPVVAVLLAGSLVVVTTTSCSPSDGQEGGGVSGVRAIRYGDEPSQIGELTVPSGPGPHPVVVLVHGGWWRASEFDRRAMRDLAEALVDDGYATWNLEYRLIGEDGGGWPGTFEDVADGIDELAAIAGDEDLDLERVAVLGHSAGGHLALWAAARPGLGSDAPGGDPAVEPRAVVAIAPVSDLRATVADGLGDGAVEALVGGPPSAVPERYALASPMELIPFDTRILVVHGTEDVVIPVEQSRTFTFASATSGDVTDYLELTGADHFVAIDPDSDAWQQVQTRLDDLLAPR